MVVHRAKSENSGQLYQKTQGSAARIEILRELRRKGEPLPQSLVRDLLEIELPTRELTLALAVCDPSHGDAFEELLLARIGERDQPVALLCLDAWRRHTPRRRWREIVRAAPELSRREGTLAWLVEHAWHAGGADLLRAVVAEVPLGEVSEVVLAALLHRLLQWSIADESALAEAERILARAHANVTPGVATASACAYVLRFGPGTLFDLIGGPLPPRQAIDMVDAYHHLWLERGATIDALARFAAAPPVEPVAFFRELNRRWPPLCLRHEIPATLAGQVIAEVLKRPRPGSPELPTARRLSWEWLAGLGADSLATATSALSEIVGLLLPAPSEAAPDSERPPRPDNTVRTALIARLYLDAEAEVPKGETPWRALLLATARSTQSPDSVADSGPVPDAELASALRRIPPVFRQVAARFVETRRPSPALIPELLPWLIGAEPHDLPAIVRALAAIGTPAALTPALRLLSDDATPPGTALELAQTLAAQDLGSVRGDVRAALEYLTKDERSASRARRELIDAVRLLLQPGANEAPAADAATVTDAATLARVDREIAALVPLLPTLPADVVRSLRTARLVQHSLETLLGQGSVDASPAVDLQYKALEILLRRRFLASTQALIDDPRAPLQRRLDAIGYGGVGRNRVEAFESHLAALPAVRDLPSFGAMKLNKLLTSLAQHRPGRRFSLEGLKAFMLFFLAFGRSRCEFGLGGAYAVGVEDDAALFELCRDMSLFHDLRNVAVHEGLASASRRDVEALWSMTNALVARFEAAAHFGTAVR